MTSTSIPVNMVFAYPVIVFNGTCPMIVALFISPKRLKVIRELYMYKMTPELTRTKPASMITLNTIVKAFLLSRMLYIDFI